MKKSIMSSSPMELVHAAGECLQVGWAKLTDVIDPVTKKKKTISVFIGVLDHSRYQMVRVVEKLDFSTTIARIAKPSLSNQRHAATSCEVEAIFINLYFWSGLSRQRYWLWISITRMQCWNDAITFG